MEELENKTVEAQTEQTPAVAEEKTVEVVDIRFRNNVKTYYFDPAGLTLAAGDHVVIDTSRGDEFGCCATGNHFVSESEIVPPLRKVIRIAGDMDERINYENQEKEKRAFEVCQQKIVDHGLDMQLVSSECAFDGSKILFFFTADGRVDFRELVKDLASVFRTRIELRQIGVRDKAKMVGGLGVCGRPFCCKEFLDDFQPVSIKMAKTQNLSLNPTKISGTCGRLMCCLKYEQEAYEDLIKTAPKNESFVDTPDGRGTVTEVNLLRQSVKVRMEDHPETIGCYQNCDICVLRSGKAKKNDPPIPRDLAPISSKPRAARKQELDLDEPLPEVIYPDEVAVIHEMPEEEEALPAEAAAEGEAAAQDAAVTQPRQGRRHRRGHRGGGKSGSGEGKAQNGEKAEAPASANPVKHGQKKDGEPTPKMDAVSKPQQSGDGQQPKADGAAPKRSNRRRYRGHRGGGQGGQNGGAPKTE